MANYKDGLSPEKQNNKGVDIRYILLYIVITAFIVLMLLDTIG